MSKNPYEILGVDKNASDADIKLAYRKLAKKHHPDLNPGNKEADQKFRELNAANNLLSDKEKRAAFDRGDIDMVGQPRQYQQQQQQYRYRDFADGSRGRRYHTTTDDFDLSDLEGLFGGFGGRAGFGQASLDVHYIIEVDFLEAARGAKKRITMPDGKILDITIPEGVDEGQQLRLKGQGKQPSGDAYVKVHIKPHPFYTRTGNDITLDLPIALHEIVLGEKIQVPTIHGPTLMTIPKGANPSAMLRLKGKGVKGGDQYIKLKLTMPKTIDSELEQMIQKWSETHAYNPRKYMEAAT